MKIREFKEADAQKVADLSNANADVFQYPNVTPQFLKRMWDHPKYKLFVLADRSEIVAFCGVNYEHLPVAELGPVCVETSRRTHGLGRLLVNALFEFLEPLNAKKVIIKVKTSNIAAQDFFKSLDFKKVEGTLVNEEPAIIMQHGLEGS